MSTVETFYFHSVMLIKNLMQFLQDEEKEEMKEVQEMKRIHQRFSKKRQMEREARAHRRQQEYEKFFGTTPKTDSMENNNL